MFITWIGGRFFIKKAKNKQFNSFSLREEITSLALRIYFFHVVNSVTKARNYDFNLKGTRPHILFSCPSNEIGVCPVFWTHRHTFSWSREKFPVQSCLGFSENQLDSSSGGSSTGTNEVCVIWPEGFHAHTILIDLNID